MVRGRGVGPVFWVKQFFAVLIGAFVVIAAAQLLKGRAASHADVHGAVLSVITAGVFTGVNFWRRRRGQRCVSRSRSPERKGRL